jgi:2-polyprenyl-3-methyl-5-hydroxy-6-metoxy-1,4-benzoquinol methylase
MNIDLIFRKDKLDTNNLIDYSDSDFADLKNKRHFIEDYIFILIEEIIFHLSKRQLIIALSSCEVEYMILSEIEKKII